MLEVARGAGKHAWEVDMFGLPAFERVRLVSIRQRAGHRANVGPNAGCLVWHSVLQPQSRILEDLDPLVVQAHLYVYLDQEGNPSRPGDRSGNGDMVRCVGLHGMRAPRGFLELGVVLDDLRLLPADKSVVGERGPSSRERFGRHGSPGKGPHPTHNRLPSSDPRVRQMPVLSSLKLPPRQKYAVVGVFALGFS